MAEPKSISLHDEGWHTNGIDITYIKRRNTLHISGWYDSYVGIKGGELTRG